MGTCCIIGTAAKENLEYAKLHSETEFEKYRVLQDKIFMSDYNKFYKKQYRKVTYTNLLTSGRLGDYLADIDRQAQERSHRLIEGMKQAQGYRATKGRKYLRMGWENEQ